MIRRPPRSTPLYSSAASDVYKRQMSYCSVKSRDMIEYCFNNPSSVIRSTASSTLLKNCDTPSKNPLNSGIPRATTGRPQESASKITSTNISEYEGIKKTSEPL